nr:hypothetical protein CFP56_64102 [Quercus suber]
MAHPSTGPESGLRPSAVCHRDIQNYTQRDWTAQFLQSPCFTSNPSNNAQSGFANMAAWEQAMPQLDQSLSFAESIHDPQYLYDQPFGAMGLSSGKAYPDSDSFQHQPQSHQQQRLLPGSYGYATNPLLSRATKSTTFELPFNVQNRHFYQDPQQLTARNNISFKQYLQNADYAEEGAVTQQQPLDLQADSRRCVPAAQRQVKIGDQPCGRPSHLHAPKPQRRLPISPVIDIVSPESNHRKSEPRPTRPHAPLPPHRYSPDVYMQHQLNVEQERQLLRTQQYQSQQQQQQRHTIRAGTQHNPELNSSTPNIHSLALAHLNPHIKSAPHLNPFVLNKKSQDRISKRKTTKQWSRNDPLSGMNTKDNMNSPRDTPRVAMQGPSSGASSTTAVNRKDSSTVVPAAGMLKSAAISASERRESGELYLSRSKDIIRRTSDGSVVGSKQLSGRIADQDIHRYRGLPTAERSPSVVPSTIQPSGTVAKNPAFGMSDEGGTDRAKTNVARSLLSTEHVQRMDISKSERTQKQNVVQDTGSIDAEEGARTLPSHRSPATSLLASTVLSVSGAHTPLPSTEPGSIDPPQALLKRQASGSLTTPDKTLSVSPRPVEQGKRPAMDSTEPLQRPSKQPKVYPWSRGAQSHMPHDRASQATQPQPSSSTSSPSKQLSPRQSHRALKYPRLSNHDTVSSPQNHHSPQQSATTSMALPQPSQVSPPSVRPRQQVSSIIPAPLPISQSWIPPSQRCNQANAPLNHVHFQQQVPSSPAVQAHRQPPQPYQPPHENMPPPYNPVVRPYILEGRTDNYANRLIDTLAKKARVEAVHAGEEWASLPPIPQPEFHFRETEAECPTCARSNIWSDELRRARHDRYIGKDMQRQQ